MTSGKKKIVIIGGGIIGCSIADELAGHGHDVIVLERGELCAEASWAAAGMLAPHAETVHSIPACLHRLMLASHSLYPGFVTEIEKETGIHVGFQRRGSLLIASDYKESKLLAGILEESMRTQTRVEELQAPQIHSMLPEISKEVETGLFFPGDNHIDGRALCRAVIARAVKRGVCFNTAVHVDSMNATSSRVSSVTTADSEIHADIFVVASGAWSAGILKSIGIDLPIWPIRGQIIELGTSAQSIKFLVHTSSCYIVPRPDGRTLVGATMEKVGFDRRVTAGGVQHLIRGATAVFPFLKDATLCGSWAGLRPDTRDNLPIIGPAPLPNLLLATGHFRNGILLAPITAKLITALVDDQNTSLPLEDFAPQRFLPEPPNKSFSSH